MQGEHADGLRPALPRPGQAADLAEGAGGACGQAERGDHRGGAMMIIWDRVRVRVRVRIIEAVRRDLVPDP